MTKYVEVDGIEYEVYDEEDECVKPCVDCPNPCPLGFYAMSRTEIGVGA